MLTSIKTEPFAMILELSDTLPYIMPTRYMLSIAIGLLTLTLTLCIFKASSEAFVFQQEQQLYDVCCMFRVSAVTVQIPVCALFSLPWVSPGSTAPSVT